MPRDQHAACTFAACDRRDGRFVGGVVSTKTDSQLGEVTEYDYDELGNLLGVELPSGTQISYIHDARNRRIAKRIDGVVAKGWIYGDQLSPVAELDSNGEVVSRFVYGLNPVVPAYMEREGQRYRFITDHLGSVRKVINVDDGTVVQELEYVLPAPLTS